MYCTNGRDPKKPEEVLEGMGRMLSFEMLNTRCYRDMQGNECHREGKLRSPCLFFHSSIQQKIDKYDTNNMNISSFMWHDHTVRLIDMVFNGGSNPRIVDLQKSLIFFSLKAMPTVSKDRQ